MAVSDTIKYYVDGGILIDTPYFKFENAGAGFSEEAIKDAKPLATNRVSREYGKYLLIDDSNPQSIFSEYYAGTFFSTGYLGAPMFTKTYDDCRQEFKRHINDIDVFLSISDREDVEGVKDVLLRQCIISVISALDTFIADIVLTKITNNKDAFYKYAYAFVLKSESEEITPRIEQRVIDSVLRRSFMNKQTIRETIQVLFGVDLAIDSGLETLIINRHLLVHRCGRKKDGSHLSFVRNDIENVIRIVEGFVDVILKVTESFP